MGLQRVRHNLVAKHTHTHTHTHTHVRTHTHTHIHTHHISLISHKKLELRFVDTRKHSYLTTFLLQIE